MMPFIAGPFLDSGPESAQSEAAKVAALKASVPRDTDEEPGPSPAKAEGQP